MVEKLTFEEWMKKVDAFVAARTMGLDTNDLPDQCYDDMYADGYTPREAGLVAIHGDE